MAKPKSDTVDQPTLAPSRKMEGVGAAYPVGSALGAIIVWALGPDVAGLNVPTAIDLAIMSVCTGGAMFVAGYFRKETKQPERAA